MTSISHKKQARDVVRTLSNTVSAVAILLLAATPLSGAHAEWRDLGPVSKFSQAIDQQCAYRVAWKDSQQPADDMTSETAQFTYSYKYTGPYTNEPPVEATNMDVYVPGHLTYILANAGLIPKTFDALEEANDKAPAKLRAHLSRQRSSDNFLIITPTWKDVDHGDYFLDASKFNLQKNCK